jgi:crossover junction endodeoxyribonuclease RusA
MTTDRGPIVLNLPYPPSANRYWRVYRGKPVPSKEAVAYKEEVKRKTSGVVPFPADVKVALRVNVYRDAMRGDLSNRIKILEDSLNGIAYVDDKQVHRLEFEMYDDAVNPRVEVEVYEVYNWPAPIRKPRKSRSKKTGLTPADNPFKSLPKSGKRAKK